MQNARLDEAQAWIEISGRNINNLRYANDTTLMTESEEDLKTPLLKVKEESEKDVLKLNIKKTKIRASGPITSWQIYGETMEKVTNFLLGSKISVDCDYSHEIKRCLLLGRKVMVFPVVMYECESWTIKTAEHCTIDAFKLWCWWRLESTLDCKEIKPVNPIVNQPWIFIEKIDGEAKAPILWPPDAKSWLTEKDPVAGKDWGQGEKGAT